MRAARRTIQVECCPGRGRRARQARYGVRRRDRGMDHCGIRQPRRPGLEFRAVRDGECQVIQAGARLVERVLAAVPMLLEPQASSQAVMSEKHLAASPAGRLELAHAPEAEHFLIRGRARVNVTNRQPKVMNASDHVLFTASMPRAASRTGLALHQAPGLHGPSSPLDHLIQMPHETSGAPPGGPYATCGRSGCSPEARRCIKIQPNDRWR